MKKIPEIKNRGSLLTFGDDQCVGHLIYFKGKGVFEPNYGKVDITPEEAEIHNKLLSQAEIDGLDNCKIGESGVFYLQKVDGLYQVHTFTGTIVSTTVSVIKDKIVFIRNQKAFKGIRRKSEDCFIFRRVS